MNRKAHWENVYETKVMAEVSWFQREPAMSLEMIALANPAKDAAIIDVGGGTSPLTAELMARGYTNLSVLDISGRALELAAQALPSDAIPVHWIEADVTQFEAPQRYALWHDRAVFHFLTDASDQLNYAAVLKRSLLPGAHVVLAAFAPDGPNRCSGLDTMQYDGARAAAVLGTDFVLLEERREQHTTPSGGTQAFSWMRFLFQPS